MAYVAGCTQSQDYVLNSGGTLWRTRCDLRRNAGALSGGWTLIAMIARNFRTRFRTPAYTDFPSERTTRNVGDTFMYKGDLGALGATAAIEGVACRGAQNEFVSGPANCR